MRGRDGDKEIFFQCLDRVPSGIHIDADFPSDDDDDEDDARASFSSAMDHHQFQSFRRHQAAVLLEDEDDVQEEAEMEDASKYDMWMSDEPMSLQERRRRLHQGLGMVSSRDLALRRHSTKKRFVDVPRSVSRRLMQLQQQPPPPSAVPAAYAPSVAAAARTTTTSPPKSGLAAARDMLKQPPARPITRRRSDSFLAARDGTPAPASGKPSLRRARSLLSPHDPCSSSLADKFKATRHKPDVPVRAAPTPADKDSKNDGDDGRTKKQEKEASVVAAPKDQNQTGVQMGLEEIEKFIGNTPIMKHLMRRGPSQHHSAPLPAPTGGAPPKADNAKDTLPEHLVVPDKVFALAEQPLCVLEGHDDDVLDLTWSKSDQLLSSSMDKTVRLWDTTSKTCLKKFSHSDYVTSIQFNPVDDRYFISGSLDAKVRLWSIPNRQVVDWTDVNEMVTATSYTPDGQGAIIGSHQGSCRFYKTADCKLSPEAQIEIDAKKKKSQAKKITGFQFSPANSSEVLVTSADSQIRVFDGVTLVQKFRGFKNTSSQITAAYTCDGRYVVCASEDSHVYVWKTTRTAPAAAAIGIGMKPKTWCTIRSYENFYCKDVSAAVPWTQSPSLPGSANQGGVSCNDEVCTMASHAGKAPDVSKSGELYKSGELCSPAAPSPHSGPLGSAAGEARHGGKSGDTGNAWGLVVVTATLSGEIRVYQNFGMPFRIKGQGNLFY
uniref:Uncharacterized protein n=1 Tax=Avena sativa TaxID=4498 RepID=A0ACD5YIU9_AVESA